MKLVVEIPIDEGYTEFQMGAVAGRVTETVVQFLYGAEIVGDMVPEGFESVTFVTDEPMTEE